MEARIPVYAAFEVSAPRPFRVTRLLDATTQTRPNPQLRPRPSQLWTMPDGSVLLNASLDGAGAALLAWNSGAFQSIVAAGTASNSPGSMVSDLGTHSVTADGSQMIQEITSDGNMVQLADNSPIQPLLVDNTSAAGMENLCCFNVNRNSRSSNGYFVFTGWFRVPGT